MVEEFATSLRDFIIKTVKLECKRRSSATFDNIEDAVGESLLEVWQALDSFNAEKSQFTTWVSTIVLRNIVDIFRKYNKRQELSLEPAKLDYPPIKGPFQVIAMRQLLAQLDDDDKSFVESKLQGLSEVELAAKFGQNPKWAKNKWFRLAEKMRLLASANE